MMEGSEMGAPKTKEVPKAVKVLIDTEAPTAMIAPTTFKAETAAAIAAPKRAKFPKSVDECATMEELVQMFARKTSMLEKKLEFRNLSYNACCSLSTLQDGTQKLQYTLRKLNEEIVRAQNNSKKMQSLNTKLLLLNQSITHAFQSMPEELKKKEEIPPKPVIISPDIEEPPKPVRIETQSKPKKRIHTITPLSLPEFQGVPKYMKGRFTLETLNNFVEDFNKCVKAKYQYIAMPRSQLGTAGFKLVQEMKSQETADTKGHYFCVMRDLKKFGGVKSENNAKAILTILRHCSRIKEIRGPGPIVRYLVIDI